MDAKPRGRRYAVRKLAANAFHAPRLGLVDDAPPITTIDDVNALPAHAGTTPSVLTDPLFVDPTAGDDHLSAASPLINAGHDP